MAVTAFLAGVYAGAVLVVLMPTSVWKWFQLE